MMHGQPHITYSYAPLNGVWARADNVGIDKESYSEDAAHNSRENSQRMPAAPSAKSLAFAAPWCDTVAHRQIHNFPYNQ